MTQRAYRGSHRDPFSDFQMTLSDGTALVTDLARVQFEPAQVIDLSFGSMTTDTHGHVWPGIGLILSRPN